MVETLKDMELKPCPFCGSQPRLRKEGSEEALYYTVIRCNTCLQSVATHLSEEVAIACWNKRVECKCNYNLRSTNEKS